MAIIFIRHLRGQTPLGIFGGIGERYIALHVGTLRAEVVW